MGNLPSQQHEHEQLKQQLLGGMRVTWEAYGAASE